MSQIKKLGVMLDCSRNAVMKPESIKKFADTISKMGYNMIQLYTEDTYEIDGEPYFGHQRGRFTKAELKELDAYCASIGIELVPCIQVLAHLNQIARWGEYYSYIDCNDILLAGDDRTYRLIDRMFTTLEECFTSNVVNIGMDEAHFVGLGKYLDQHGYQNRGEVIGNHLKRVHEIAKNHGFDIMMWSDMFFRLTNNGDYYAAEPNIPQEVIDSVPEGTKLVYWDYYSTDRTRYENCFRAHKLFKNETIFAGGLWTWNGFAPNTPYALKATQVAFESVLANGIETAFLTLWGDDGKECSYFAALPALFAASQYALGNFDMDDIKAKFLAFSGYEFDEFMMLALPNDVGVAEENTHNPCKYLLYNDPFMGLFDANVKPDFAARFAANAKALNEKIDSREYSYLFDYAKKLIDVLEVKCDLGVKTREAYNAKDTEALLNLANNEYTTAIERIEIFFESFKNVWYTENKTFGFEVQEIRIGGLMLRLKSCKERLIAYANGEISAIEELEQPVLPIYRDCYDTSLGYNIYRQNVTTSVM